MRECCGLEPHTTVFVFPVFYSCLKRQLVTVGDRLVFYSSSEAKTMAAHPILCQYGRKRNG